MAEHFSARQEEMEEVAPPPPPQPGPGDAVPATEEDAAALRDPHRPPKTIAGAASIFRKACDGGDSYENNCAHYLSDAFLRAGFAELQAPAPCVTARCGTAAKRPVRARDMWCWFKSMATHTRDTLPKNEGMWTVFQLDEAAYWGGHVIIFDSDRNVYYGTAHYPSWKQHCFKW
jgi:hypothetical protein